MTSKGRIPDRLLRYFALAVLILTVAGCWFGPVGTNAPTATPPLGPQVTTPGAPPPSPTVTSPAPTPTWTVQVPADQALAMAPAAVETLGRLHDLSHYDISVQVDPADLTYTGQLRLAYVNAEEVPLDALYFRLFPNSGPIYGGGALTVTQAQVDGMAVTPQTGADARGMATEDQTVLEVPLDGPLPRGGRATVELTFEGRIPRDFGEDQEGYGVFNASDGLITMAGFYPILAVYNQEGWNLDPVYPEGDAVFSDAAFFTVHVTVPQGWSAVTSGVEVSGEPAGEGESTQAFATGPMRDFFLALSRELRVSARRVGDVTVNSYWSPDHEESGVRALEVAVEALETFSDEFGPYPYRELDVVEADLNLAAGVEYPGVILIGSEYYSGNDQVLEHATAHEVAHQWWYGVVGNDVIDAPWLDEALAQYSTLLYFEAVYGQERYDQVRESWQQRVDQAVEEGRDDVVGSPMSHWTERPEAYGPIVYLKGPLFFHALREQVGNETFFEILHRYYETYAYGIATPEGFLGVAEEVAGEELDELYRQWILTAKGR